MTGASADTTGHVPLGGGGGDQCFHPETGNRRPVPRTAPRRGPGGQDGAAGWEKRITGTLIEKDDVDLPTDSGAVHAERASKGAHALRILMKEFGEAAGCAIDMQNQSVSLQGLQMIFRK